MKLKSKDGKYRETDVLDVNSILRLIESVPSAKIELFKLWLANIVREEKTQGMKENISVAKKGGTVAKDARVSYEKATNKSAISKDNNLNYKYINDSDKLENK